jgi:quinol monooxygenase YgiN
MYATIRQYTVKPEQKAEVLREVRENFTPLLREIPGLVSYEGIDAGDDLVFVSVFETKEGAEESTRRATEFAKQRPRLADLLPGRKVSEGEVAVHTAIEPGRSAASGR